MNGRDYIVNRIKELELDLKRMKSALFAYDNVDESSNVIENLKQTQSSEKTNIYEGTWIENILTVIKNKDRFLHNSEIANELYSTYQDKDENFVKRRISAVLSNALSKGDIESLTNYRFTNSIKDTVWGKKEWFDEQGKIKKEYMFKSKDTDKNNNTFDF